jgi:hypothetical protein
MSRRFLRSTRLLALVILTSLLLPSFTVAPTLAATTHPATDAAPPIASAVLPALAAPVAAQNEPPHRRKLDSRPQPLAFLSNVGQTDGKVKFHVQGLGGMIFFTQDEVVLAFPNDRPPGKKNRDSPRSDGASPSRTVMRIRYEGANTASTVIGVDQQPGVANYLIGNDSAKWRRNVPSYASVVYTDLYPGIDLRYDGTGGQLKSTYTVAPGADPTAIRWRYTGAADARVDAAGNLVVSLPDPSGQVTATAALTRTLIEHTPIAWQEIAGQRVPVTVRYTLAANQRVGFQLGGYDATQPLVLDPTFSTYLGGSGTEEAQDVAVGADSNVYVTGSTNSTLFPTLNPAQGANGGNYDAFVAKYSDSGLKIYATYFGGNNYDTGLSIAVDIEGAVYVTGETASTNLAPLPATPIQAQLRGSSDGFVIKLNNQGNALIYATYLGGDATDAGYGIAVENNTFTAYVTGKTTSDLFPGAQNTRIGSSDAFIARLNAAGTALLFSRYHGGNDADIGYDIALDSNNAYVTGQTRSTTSFPIVSAYQTNNGGGTLFDAFVAEFDSNGGIFYSTYLGGNANDSGLSIAVEHGHAYVTGTTSSLPFPGTNANSLQPSCGNSPCTDAFVAKLSPNGAALLYSTYIGGDDYDDAYSIAVTNAGQVYLAGFTSSSNFPTQSPFQASRKGSGDAFVTVIDPALPGAQALLYST